MTGDSPQKMRLQRILKIAVWRLQVPRIGLVSLFLFLRYRWNESGVQLRPEVWAIYRLPVAVQAIGIGSADRSFQIRISDAGSIVDRRICGKQLPLVVCEHTRVLQGSSSPPECHPNPVRRFARHNVNADQNHVALAFPALLLQQVREVTRALRYRQKILRGDGPVMETAQRIDSTAFLPVKGTAIPLRPDLYRSGLVGSTRGGADIQSL